ncbi:hypothetical protein EDC04DRAFT_2698705 [Pisolithus marmoratus]|nr:hypothetical protein EDC04DRAFT_2698684 [Pisolithus marmoratus]KAI6038065.1 hypothetical protein EDC04DRAFT_2698705 [Pisolithus marmoratus]
MGFSVTILLKYLGTFHLVHSAAPAPPLNLPLLNPDTVYVSLTPMVVAASWLVGSRMIAVRKRGSPDARAKAPRRRGQSHWRNSLPLLSPVLVCQPCGGS